MGNIYSRIMNVSSLFIPKLPLFGMWESQSPIFLATYHRRWKSHIPTSIPDLPQLTPLSYSAHSRCLRKANRSLGGWSGGRRS
jgi:hypothetical protein